jgi:hypothetical protein
LHQSSFPYFFSILRDTFFLHSLSSARKPDTCRSRKFQSADCFCRFKAGFPTSHRLRSPNETFFHRNSKLFGLGRQFGQINFGAFWVFLANLSAPIFGTVNILSMFSINQPLFLQKTYLLLPLGKWGSK